MALFNFGKRPLEQPVSDDRSAGGHADTAAAHERREVDRADLDKRGVWKAPDGSTVRLDLEKGTMMIRHLGESVPQESMTDHDSALAFLRKGRYVFEPALPKAPAKPSPESPEGGSETSEPSQTLEISDRNLEQEVTALDTEISAVLSGKRLEGDNVLTAVDTARELLGSDEVMAPLRDEAGDIEKRARQVLDEMSEIAFADREAAKSAQKTGTIDSQYIADKRRRFGTMTGLGDELTRLRETAQALVEAVKRVSVPTADTGAEPEASQAQSGASEQSEQQKQKGRPETIGAVLGELRTYVVGLIAGLTTPAEYEKFRRGMKIVGTGERAKRYFFDRRDIEQRIGKSKLDEAEAEAYYQLQDELEELTRQKFFELKNADLRQQIAQARVSLEAVPDEEARAALAEAWAVQPPLANPWTEAWEREKVQPDYNWAWGFLQQALEKRKQELVDQLALDTFRETGEGSEAVRVYEEVLGKEWSFFAETLRTEDADIRPKERDQLWREVYLPTIERAVLGHLMTLPDMDEARAQSIFRAIVHERKQKARAPRSVAGPNEQTVN